MPPSATSEIVTALLNTPKSEWQANAGSSSRPYIGEKWPACGLKAVPRIQWDNKPMPGKPMYRPPQNCGDARLYAHIHDDNLASRNLFKSLGFREESHGYVNTYGHWRDNGSEFALDVGLGAQQ